MNPVNPDTVDPDVYVDMLARLVMFNGLHEKHSAANTYEVLQKCGAAWAFPEWGVVGWNTADPRSDQITDFIKDLAAKVDERIIFIKTAFPNAAIERWAKPEPTPQTMDTSQISFSDGHILRLGMSVRFAVGGAVESPRGSATVVGFKFDASDPVDPFRVVVGNPISYVSDGRLPEGYTLTSADVVRP